MFRCIYSLTDQESSTGEHILQNFLGARRTSCEIVSNDLQKVFGEGIDLDFARTMQVIQNLIGTKGGRGGEAPTLRGRTTSAGQRVNLLPGGHVQMAEPVLVEVDLPNGQKQMKVTVSNEKQLDWAIAQIKEKYPKTVIDRNVLLASAKLTENYINEPVMHELNLGGPELFRGLLKACFNLFGATLPEIAVLSCFNGIRDYIREGTGGAAAYARWYGSAESPELPKLGEADHHIFIVSRGSSVEGIARLFGALNYPFRLAEAIKVRHWRAATLSIPFARPLLPSYGSRPSTRRRFRSLHSRGTIGMLQCLRQLSRRLGSSWNSILICTAGK